jgi:HK97 family phage prohead protease
MAGIDDIDLVPTDAMVEEAKRGLAWRDEFNRGGTAVGVARARDISNKVRLSPETVQRMASFFARHEVDKQGQGFEVGEDGYPSAGRIAWALWGGDAGQSWADARLAQIAALEADRSLRMIDLDMYPLNERQLAQYENTEAVVEKFGQYDQTAGADGCGYQAESEQASDGIACGSCVFFMDGMCEVVAGEIAAAGLCKLWVIPAGLLEGEPVVEVDPEPVVEVDPEPVVESQPMVEGYTRSAAGVDVPEREVRKLAKLEVRATPDGGATLEGYATVYNYAYDLGGGPSQGGFTEIIASGAAAKSAGEADVRLLVNHDGIPLARTKSGTMTLQSDDIGLRVSAQLDPTNPMAASLRSAMERGDMDQMSFAFKVIRDSWDAQYDVRTIHEVKLYDVSVVTYPASAATVAKLRNDAQGSEQATGRSVEMAKRQLEAITARR